MAQVENPPSDDLPEHSPENQSSSDSHQPNTNDENSLSRHNKHSKVMENCIAFFLKFGAAASPTKTVSPKLKALIEQRLVESFPVHHRPDHLPYAAMIETAISTLNEKSGSSEEAISHFIRKENHDLPWAHDMFVKHHLENLCKDGSIFKTRYGLYMTTTDTDPSILSSTSDIPSSSNSDGDADVSEIQKGRLSLIKVATKMRRLKRMNKEKESEEDTMDDGLANTSTVKQGSDKDEEENLSLEEYKKVTRIRTKEKMMKKQFTEELAIVALNGHGDMVDKELNGISGAQEDVVGQELAIVALNGQEDTVYKELNGSGAQEEVVGQELAIVSLNGHEDTVYKELNGSGARGEVVGQDQDDNVMRIQMDMQESEAHVKQFDHLIEGKRGVTGLKDKPRLEETNQLQEHNVGPISDSEQCCVEKKKEKYQLPKRNRKGQKVCIMPAGRRRGKRSNDNESSVYELNEDQTLMEVLNAIKRGKKGKVMVEERTEHTAHRIRLPEGKEIVMESRKHEAFGAGKGDVVVEGKDEKKKPHVVVIGLSRKHEAFDLVRGKDAVVIGLFSSSCGLGTK